MRLYIWEGAGISDAYHDDGTLVVLAESAEQARAIVRAEKEAQAENHRRLDAPAIKAKQRAFNVEERRRVAALGGYRAELWQTPEGKAIQADRAELNRSLREEAACEERDYWSEWDGSDAALRREPDRVVDLASPAVVAFNGGGYD